MTEKLTEEDKVFASEYAMGVLEQDEMIAAEKRCELDPEFSKEVEAWQERLLPMLDQVSEVVPDDRIWDNISRSVSGPVSEAKTGIWNSLPFWRGLSLIGLSAAILALTVVFLNLQPVLPVAVDKTLLAILTSDSEAPPFLVRYDPENSALDVQVQLQKDPQGRARELWIIPPDGTPKSLGLLDAGNKGIISVGQTLQDLMVEGNTLAVSLEPQGGSPTGLPTGPVVASGILKLL